MPTSYYPWAVHYRKSLFEEGLHHSDDQDELVALATKMEADGLIPFAMARTASGRARHVRHLNLRLNGYQFHVHLLAGKENWTGPEVKKCTRRGPSCCRSTRRPERRNWEEAFTSLENKEAGMMFLGTFVAENSRMRLILDDLDFFDYHFDAAIDTDASMLPDGLTMAAKPKNVDGAKACRRVSVRPKYIDAYMGVNPNSVRQLVGRHVEVDEDPGGVSEDRRGGEVLVAVPRPRHEPDFVSNVIGDAFANFHAEPTRLTRSWLTSKPRSDLSQLTRLRLVSAEATTAPPGAPRRRFPTSRVATRSPCGCSQAFRRSSTSCSCGPGARAWCRCCSLDGMGRAGTWKMNCFRSHPAAFTFSTTSSSWLLQQHHPAGVPVDLQRDR